MQAVYQYIIQKGNEEEILEYTVVKDEYIPETQEFAKELFRGVFTNKELIEALISSHSIDWKIERIAIIDKSILMVSIWELLYTATSVKVIISESIELVKKYSAYEAIKFINGVLGSIAKERETLREKNNIEVVCLAE